MAFVQKSFRAAAVSFINLLKQIIELLQPIINFWLQITDLLYQNTNLL